MKISNFTPDWGDLIAGGVSVAAEQSGRDTVILSLTNRSGSARSRGDVVILDSANAESFTTSTSSNTVKIVGVLDEDIGIASNGRVILEGRAPAVNTLGVSAVGDFLFGSTTTAKAAHMAGTVPSAGAFGQVLTGGSNTNSTAYIFPTTQASTLSAASNTTDVGSSVVVGATGKYSDGAHVHRGMTSFAHSSNSYYGTVTLTTPGDTVAITSPSAGTLALSAPQTVGIGASAYNSVVQSVATATNTALTLNSEFFDPQGFHSTSVNTSRMTVPGGLAGKYVLTGSTYFAGAAVAGTVGRVLRFRINGTTYLADSRFLPANTAAVGLSVSAITDLAAGDYVELMAYQDSGGNLDIGFTAPSSAVATLSLMQVSTAATVSDWTSYTPTWSSDGTQPTLGNGTLTGRYKRIDAKTYHVTVRLVWGSTTSAGTGSYYWSLPSGLLLASSIRGAVSGGALDSGTRWYAGSATGSPGTGTMTIILADASGAHLAAAGIPVTWAAGDEMFFSGIVEVA